MFRRISFSPFPELGPGKTVVSPYFLSSAFCPIGSICLFFYLSPITFVGKTPLPWPAPRWRQFFFFRSTFTFHAAFFQFSVSFLTRDLWFFLPGFTWAIAPLFRSGLTRPCCPRVPFPFHRRMFAWREGSVPLGDARPTHLPSWS